jgi:CubicO group peptidase (beta-lactamase class C family)
MLGAAATLGAAFTAEASPAATAAPKGASRRAAPPHAVLSGSSTAGGPTTANKTGGGVAHEAMLKTLTAYVQQHRANWGLPGMTVCVVDRKGFTGFIRSGWADIDRKVPYAPEHLCQVGSITKQMVALTLWSIFDEGKLSPDTPFEKALPGIKVKDGEGIRLQHLLNHTSGMPNIAPYFNEMGGLWSSYTPGSHWNYCNIGYALLGDIIAEADGRPFEQAVKARVFDNIGMNSSVGAIRCTDRHLYPVGYLPYVTDRATLNPGPVAPAPWADVDNTAGSNAATIGDMARYLRFMLALTQGKGSGVLTDASAAKFLANPADAPADGPGVRYGNGVGHYPIDGRVYLHHTGGMVSVVSSMHVDPEAGVAAFASTNIGYAAGNYRPKDITLYACNLLRTLNAGSPAPAPRPPRPVVDKPGQYAGVFTSAKGDRLEVVAGTDALTLRHGGAASRMQQWAGPFFACEAPQFQVTGLMFDVENGKAVRVWAGDVEYLVNPAAGYRPPAPRDLQLIAGRYDGTRIYARDGALWRNNREKLIPLPNGDYRIGPDWSPERVRFDGVFAGRPQRMLTNGAPNVRVAFV